MQMFGVGALELMVILILAVLVVGPDRLPQVAADLAQWIRRARVYANHLSKDFNEVVGELEKEVGASREDWKEIAGVVTRQGGAVGSAVTSAASALEKSLDEPKAQTARSENGSAAASTEATPLGETPVARTAMAPTPRSRLLRPRRRARGRQGLVRDRQACETTAAQ